MSGIKAPLHCISMRTEGGNHPPCGQVANDNTRLGPSHQARGRHKRPIPGAGRRTALCQGGAAFDAGAVHDHFACGAPGHVSS